MHPVLPVAEQSQLVYGWLIYIFHFVVGKSAFGYSFIAVLLLYIQALLLNGIVNRHRLFKQNTYLVAFAFLSLGALHPALGQFNAMSFVCLCILFIINQLLQLKQSLNASKQLFNIGFVLMLAVLLQFSALFLVPFAFFALVILRPFNFKEWMIMLVGLTMPLYMLLVLLFCTDKLSIMHFWPDLGISLPRKLHPELYFAGFFTGIFIWMFFSLFNMQRQLPKAPIYIRRCWIAFTVLIFVSLISAIFSDPKINSVWMITLPGLSLMLAHAFINERSKKMNAISFYFALALVVFCQIFLPL